MHPRNDDYQLLPQSDDSHHQSANTSLYEMEEVVVEGDRDDVKVDFTALMTQDLLIYIIKYLPTLQDVARIAQVNSACRAAVMSPHFSYETKALIYDFGHNVDELPILRPGYVRGTHAQLQEFLKSYPRDLQQFDKLNRTPCINSGDMRIHSTMIFFIGSSLSFLLTIAGQVPAMLLKEDVSTAGFMGSSLLVLLATVASEVFLIRISSRKRKERDATVARLHHNSLFAPQEFGVTVSFEPTQEHVEAAAQPGVEMG